MDEDVHLVVHLDVNDVVEELVAVDGGVIVGTGANVWVVKVVGESIDVVLQVVDRGGTNNVGQKEEVVQRVHWLNVQLVEVDLAGVDELVVLEVDVDVELQLVAVVVCEVDGIEGNGRDVVH